tara:strand:+ start:2617 stop:2790 length:174 start_codon:yes stop_codon:yes gene_type:complete
MSRYAKIEMILPESVVSELKNAWGDKLTEVRLIKKAVEHHKTETIIHRNLIGDGRSE